MSEPLYVDAAEKRSFGDVLEENARLRLALRRLADQDATLSVSAGNVTVTTDATLTDAERDAVERAASVLGDHPLDEDIDRAVALRGLLWRMGGER